MEHFFSSFQWPNFHSIFFINSWPILDLSDFLKTKIKRLIIKNVCLTFFERWIKMKASSFSIKKFRRPFLVVLQKKTISIFNQSDYCILRTYIQNAAKRQKGSSYFFIWKLDALGFIFIHVSKKLGIRFFIINLFIFVFKKSKKSKIGHEFIKEIEWKLGHWKELKKCSI